MMSSTLFVHSLLRAISILNTWGGMINEKPDSNANPPDLIDRISSERKNLDNTFRFMAHKWKSFCTLKCIKNHFDLDQKKKKRSFLQVIWFQISIKWTLVHFCWHSQKFERLTASTHISKISRFRNANCCAAHNIVCCFPTEQNEQNEPIRMRDTKKKFKGRKSCHHHVTSSSLDSAVVFDLCVDFCFCIFAFISFFPCKFFTQFVFLFRWVLLIVHFSQSITWW